jgi:hypothetical protein
MLEYAQKLKLAQQLHDQGINPERWGGSRTGRLGDPESVPRDRPQTG